MSNLILHCDVKSEKNHKIPKSRFKNISAKIRFFNFNFFFYSICKIRSKTVGFVYSPDHLVDLTHFLKFLESFVFDQN